jgi:uncharacterized oligopeptide transporter (OPT) family protein
MEQCRVHFRLSQRRALVQVLNKLRGFHVQTTLPVFGTAAAAYGWKLGANAGYIGQGMIMGPRVCFSMLAGSVAGFGILAPLAVKQGWASIDKSSSRDGYATFVTWVAMSIMIADSLTSLAVLLCRYGYQIAVNRVRSRGYASFRSGEVPVVMDLEETTAFGSASGTASLPVPACSSIFMNAEVPCL